MRLAALTLALVAGHSLSVNYDNYSEVYQSTADSYLSLFESSTRPVILLGYLREAAETLKKSEQYGDLDAARVEKVRKYYKFLKSDPVEPQSAEYKAQLASLKTLLDSLK